MTPGLLKITVIVALVAVAVVLVLLAVRRTRSEPRRLSNGVLIGLAALSTGEALSALGAPGTSMISALAVLIVVLGPLLVVVLAVLLIMNGVQMIKRESRSLGNLLSLLLGIGLLGLGALPVVVLALGGGARGLAVTVGIGLVAAYAGFALVNFLVYAQIYRRLVRGAPADWLVVLGSGLGADGRVPPLLASRVRTGLAEAARRRVRVVVMSGGRGSDEVVAEGEAMAALAVEHGADPSRVLVEGRSTDTEENLRFTRELLASTPLPAPLPAPLATLAPARPAPLGTPLPGTRPPVEPSAATGSGGLPGPGLIVTSNYHAMRAAVLARKLGIDAQAVGSPTAGYYWPSAVLREFVALLAEHPWWHLTAALLVGIPVPALVFALS
ncbi:uncharacterized SAM-binding protein YcdF (DUF218 family) [Friedmanniella endophytica]|uniref:Uncharacterized SAM-binding protein YcdF (DUF218 family) n=1 Tax=Microlunatus kandeliicorticis TaxID=1759536 RepID=A0A7W3ITS4_9ACTN|nr:YdcF family protein [Microlunatus kandeliicorticis]MBA8795116.1 uncharacterized SAM-binding protein YcdF (DUF218 family) [Microlunatus kandeliicorticis]